MQVSGIREAEILRDVSEVHRLFSDDTVDTIWTEGTGDI